jgi:hypothetical protein
VELIEQDPQPVDLNIIPEVKKKRTKFKAPTVAPRAPQQLQSQPTQQGNQFPSQGYQHQFPTQQGTQQFPSQQGTQQFPSQGQQFPTQQVQQQFPSQQGIQNQFPTQHGNQQNQLQSARHKLPQKERQLDFPLNNAPKIDSPRSQAHSAVAGGWGQFIEEEENSDEDDWTSDLKLANEQQQLALARNVPALGIGGLKRASSFDGGKDGKRQVLGDEYRNKPAEQDWYGNEKKKEKTNGNSFIKAGDGMVKQPVKSFAPSIPTVKSFAPSIPIGQRTNGTQHHIGKFVPVVAKFPPNAPRAKVIVAPKQLISGNGSKSHFQKSTSKPAKPVLTTLAGYPPLAASLRFPSKSGIDDVLDLLDSVKIIRERTLESPATFKTVDEYISSFQRMTLEHMQVTPGYFTLGPFEL